MNVNHRIVVDFKTAPGKIMACTYPPAIWTRSMRTMHFSHLEDKQYQSYVKMRDEYRKKGGIKIRTQDPITGEMKTEALNTVNKDGTISSLLT